MKTDSEKRAQWSHNNRLYHAAHKDDPVYKAARARRRRIWYRANKRRKAAMDRAWRERHPARWRQLQRRARQKPQQRMMHNLAKRFRAFVRKGRTASKPPLKALGCTRAHMLAYVASLFTAGMDWHNYGLWEIDHRRPIASFDLRDKQQATQCFHFTNIQPLWKVDNKAKGISWSPPPTPG